MMFVPAHVLIYLRRQETTNRPVVCCSLQILREKKPFPPPLPPPLPLPLPTTTTIIPLSWGSRDSTFIHHVPHCAPDATLVGKKCAREL